MELKEPKVKASVKRGYKTTEVGVIPEDWEVKKLGEIGDCLIGLTYTPAQVREHGTLVLRSSNVANGKLVFGDNVFVEADIPERIMVQENDILICVRNGSRDLIGKTALVDRRAKGMTFGAFMAVFRTPAASFVFNQFQSEVIKRQIHEHLGATINQITNKSLKSFQIPYTKDPAEQHAIATALSDVDGLIAGMEALLAKKRALKQGAMQQLLSGQKRLPGFTGEWGVKTMAQLGHTYGGLSAKTKSDFGIGEAYYIPFMNIMQGPVIDTGFLERVRIGAQETQNRARKGDLFFNGSSETPEEVGMCSVLQQDIDDLYLNSFSFGFRLNKEMKADAMFLSYWFRSPEGRRIIYSSAQGATRYNIAKSNFMKLEVPYPQPEEQTAIATVLSDMDAELGALEAKLGKTRLLKQGMMQELLTGRVRLV